MKFLLPLLFLSASLSGASFDETLVINELIAATKRSLATQEELQKQLVVYQNSRADYLENPDSAPAATELVRQAMRLKRHIDHENLSHLFSHDFLTELAFYNQIGKQTR